MASNSWYRTNVADTPAENQSLTLYLDGHNITIRVEHTSLLDTKVGAIVNAANEGMRGGGGIDGAIHSKAGAELLTALKEAAPQGCPTGDVVVTPGFNTGFKYILHTPGPRWQGGNSNERALLEDCYWNCMNEANMLGVDSFCSISTGIYGYPLQDGAETAMLTVLSYITSVLEVGKNISTQEIVFAMFKEAEYEAFCKAMNDIAVPYVSGLMKDKAEPEVKAGFWQRAKAYWNGLLRR
jgi:O-acetyl-ADP-ribose deacetylase (regulator of RNase III)